MITTIFCVVDDFCKEFEQSNKKYFIEAVGTNKRNRAAALAPSEILTIFAYAYKANEDCIFYIDSTILRVCHNKRIAQNKVFKGVAQRGKSSMGWFYGFKFHYVINSEGEIVRFLITPGNVSDQNHKSVDFLTKNIQGKMFGDKGYISATLFKRLFEKGLQIVTKIKRNMKNILMDLSDKILLRKRGVVESVGNLLKNSMQIEHSRYRSIIGFFINVLSAVIAYSFLEKKPSIASKHVQISTL